ncbi:MAG TPA: endolytic transglycosylase MltG [Thermoanaerobaculia bacterium]
MKRLLWLAAALALLAAAAAGWAWRRLHQPFRGYLESEIVVDVRSGQGAQAILARLAAAGVLADARLARLYLVYALGDPALIAGEYRFDRPLSTPQVLDKVIRGEVVVYPVTLIEGLTLEETAEALARQGFGDAERLRREMQRGDRVADLDPDAEDLEGYLFPDTYHFARGITEAEVVATLVRTFRQRWREAVEPLRTAGPSPRSGATRPVRELVTLASIVEKEARLDEERALIAGVYAHRLRRGIALYADPTVIYALKRLGVWDGNLRRADLRLDSPYNTYVRPGLPPGPICSPSLASLVAAADPADTDYLYFVSRNDGSHVFAESLREHNRNVELWQRRYWRRRWAQEGSR